MEGFKQTFEFTAKQNFYRLILENLAEYSYSPFRIIPPKFQSLDNITKIS